MLKPLYMKDGILRIEFEGLVVRADWKSMLEQARKFEREADRIPSRLTDTSRVDNLEHGYYDFVDLIAQRAKEGFPNAFKSAIVAPQPIQYGCARMFQTLNNNPQISIEIFAGVDEALHWLGEPIQPKSLAGSQTPFGKPYL